MRDEDLDLLTAALIGLTVGVGVTMLIRRGPGGRRPLMAGMELAGRGARIAGMAGMTGAKVAGRAAARNAQRGWSRGMEWASELPLDDMGEQLRDYMEAAKGAIEDTVSGELQDLRKSIRRRRRRLGL
jgi:hypothetical protein